MKMNEYNYVLVCMWVHGWKSGLKFKRKWMWLTKMHFRSLLFFVEEFVLGSNRLLKKFCSNAEPAVEHLILTNCHPLQLLLHWTETPVEFFLKETEIFLVYKCSKKGINMMTLTNMWKHKNKMPRNYLLLFLSGVNESNCLHQFWDVSHWNWKKSDGDGLTDILQLLSLLVLLKHIYF